MKGKTTKKTAKKKQQPASPTSFDDIINASVSGINPIKQGNNTTAPKQPIKGSK